MSVTTWIFDPEEVKAAIGLYMVEVRGVSLDDIRSIEFLIIDGEQGSEFDGVQVSFDDPGDVEFVDADDQTGGTERKQREE
ncbi:MAG: hypothetical protein WC292_00330 [Clostridia bacterium]